MFLVLVKLFTYLPPPLSLSLSLSQAFTVTEFNKTIRTLLLEIESFSETFVYLNQFDELLAQGDAIVLPI